MRLPWPFIKAYYCYYGVVWRQIATDHFPQAMVATYFPKGLTTTGSYKRSSVFQFQAFHFDRNPPLCALDALRHFRIRYLNSACMESRYSSYDFYPLSMYICIPVSISLPWYQVSSLFGSWRTNYTPTFNILY